MFNCFKATEPPQRDSLCLFVAIYLKSVFNCLNPFTNIPGYLNLRATLGSFLNNLELLFS